MGICYIHCTLCCREPVYSTIIIGGGILTGVGTFFVAKSLLSFGGLFYYTYFDKTASSFNYFSAVNVNTLFAYDYLRMAKQMCSEIVWRRSLRGNLELCPDLIEETAFKLIRYEAFSDILEWIGGMLGMVWGFFLGDALCAVFGFSYEEIELEKLKNPPKSWQD